MARRLTGLLISAAALALAISAPPGRRCGGGAAAGPRGGAPGVARFPQRYIEQSLRANPAFAVNQGRHEYDGRLPDWSETGIHSESSRLRSAIAAAAGLRSAAADPASSGSSATI